MKILNGRINWRNNFCNDACLEILVDKIPDCNEFRYTCKSNIYYAENNGYVSFFYYVSPGNGYGGRKFNLTMEDGHIETLYGPWSSNERAVNSLGFGPCIGVSITDDSKTFKRGYTFYSGFITLDFVSMYRSIIDINKGCTINGKFINFPNGSKLYFLERNNYYSPVVLFPDGRILSKKIGFGFDSLDLSMEQIGIKL